MDVISVKYHRVQKQDGTVKKQSAPDEVKHMNLRQLADLNNKLMLIVGQDEDVKLEGENFCQASVTFFSETFLLSFHNFFAIFQIFF